MQIKYANSNLIKVSAGISKGFQHKPMVNTIYVMFIKEFFLYYMLAALNNNSL